MFTLQTIVQACSYTAPAATAGVKTTRRSPPKHVMPAICFFLHHSHKPHVRHMQSGSEETQSYKHRETVAGTRTVARAMDGPTRFDRRPWCSLSTE